MSFQFVNTTASKRKPDEKTRRKIRSQVMKDYRRRRDEDAAPSSSATRTSSANPGRSPRPPLSRTQSTHTSRPPSPTAELATPPGEVLGERSTKRGRPGKSQRMQAASLFVQTAHGLFANFTVDMPTRTHPQAEGASNSAAETRRMLEICAKYDEWLGVSSPGTAASLAPAAARGEQEASMQLYALTMNAVGHLHAIGVFQGEDERAYYKARLLGIANKLLQDPSKAMEDATLAALAYLTSYEISFNSHEALTHLIGLSRIIASRGGFQRLSDDHGLSAMLQGLDLAHALYFHTEPVFAIRSQEISSSTLRTFGDDAERQSSGGSIDESGSEEEEVRKWQDTLREASSFLQEHGSPEASRACYLTWRVHLFQPRSTAEWSGQSIGEMDELFHLMTSMPGQAWERYPALNTRVILTALATATEIAHKSWYYTQLARLMFHTEEQHWDDFLDLVTGFIRSQSYFRHPAMQTVKAVVSGVEIDVERSLAEQMGLEIIPRS